MMLKFIYVIHNPKYHAHIKCLVVLIVVNTRCTRYNILFLNYAQFYFKNFKQKIGFVQSNLIYLKKFKKLMEFYSSGKVNKAFSKYLYNNLKVI